MSIGDGRCREVSATTVTSSGTASCVLLWYASVPGTSPCLGLSSTFSTLVVGIGEEGEPSLSRASVKTSSSSFDDSREKSQEILVSILNDRPSS